MCRPASAMSVHQHVAREIHSARSQANSNIAHSDQVCSEVAVPRRTWSCMMYRMQNTSPGAGPEYHALITRNSSLEGPVLTWPLLDLLLLIRPLVGHLKFTSSLGRVWMSYLIICESSGRVKTRAAVNLLNAAMHLHTALFCR